MMVAAGFSLRKRGIKQLNQELPSLVTDTLSILPRLWRGIRMNPLPFPEVSDAYAFAYALIRAYESPI